MCDSNSEGSGPRLGSQDQFVRVKRCQSASNVLFAACRHAFFLTTVTEGLSCESSLRL